MDPTKIQPSFSLPVSYIYNDIATPVDVFAYQGSSVFPSDVYLAISLQPAGNQPAGLHHRQGDAWNLVLNFVDLCRSVATAHNIYVIVQNSAQQIFPTGSLVYRNGYLTGQTFIDVESEVFWVVLVPITTGSGVSVSNVKLVQVKLSAMNISTAEVILPDIPQAASTVFVIFGGGVPQIQNVDFVVIGNQISWLSLGMQLLAEVNDTLLITYTV